MSYHALCIRKARQWAGLTQLELAERIGIRQPNISQWESGGSPISEASMLKVAQALGLSMYQLCSGDLPKLGQKEAE